MGCLFLTSLLHGLRSSNSTSHLLYSNQRNKQQPLEEVRKRYSSSEGRFSIIDERSKDSSASEDEEGPLPNVFSVPSRVTAPPPTFSQSVNLPHSHHHMATSASRFRIVPVESRYKRGRWECFDYYQKEVRPLPKFSCPNPPRALSSLSTNDRTVRSWTTELNQVPATAPPVSNRGVSFKFDEEKPPTKHKVLNVEVDRMTPTEMLQTGLESTLNTAEIKKKENDRRISSATSHNGNSPSTVAIDSKIEQAMDLVKSHLMFAVREEVEGLRQRIETLETHIQNLESENAILRDHISPEVLNGLHSTK